LFAFARVLPTLILLPGIYLADLPKPKWPIARATFIAGQREITIWFSKKDNALIQAAGKCTNWAVHINYGDGRPSLDVWTPSQCPLLGSPDISLLRLGRVALLLSTAVQLGDYPVVQFLADSGPPVIASAKPAATPKISKDNTDLYLSGSYSVARPQTPQYSLAGSAYLTVPLNFGATELGLLGEVSTDKAATADPDSYRAFAVAHRAMGSYGGVGLQGFHVIWLVGGAEFDRRANNLNVITSPMVDLPIRLWPLGREVLSGEKPVIAALRLFGGVEVGESIKNAVRNNGLRPVERGLLGADLRVSYQPSLAVFQGFQLTANYRLRLPATAEVFTEVITSPVTGKATDDPTLSRRARHHIVTELDLFLTEGKGVAITLKHEYGSLPPAFRLVQRKISVGLTYMLQKQEGTGYSLRNR
jgi:hypothetical protein